MLSEFNFRYNHSVTVTASRLYIEVLLSVAILSCLACLHLYMTWQVISFWKQPDPTDIDRLLTLAKSGQIELMSVGGFVFSLVLVDSFYIFWRRNRNKTKLRETGISHVPYEFLDLIVPCMMGLGPLLVAGSLVGGLTDHFYSNLLSYILCLRALVLILICSPLRLPGIRGTCWIGFGAALVASFLTSLYVPEFRLSADYLQSIGVNEDVFENEPLLIKRYSVERHFSMSAVVFGIQAIVEIFGIIAVLCYFWATQKNIWPDYREIFWRDSRFDI